MKASGSARLVAAMLVTCACGMAQAAGGHHAVDDAAILSRGECEGETWFSGEAGGRRLLHAGANCRVGPVELGTAGEYARGDGPSATQWNVEVKWARKLTEGFSVGLDLQPQWSAHRHPRYAGTRFAALATWSPSPAWALHANAGRDFLRGDRDLPNGGLAVEWTAIPRWSFVAERYLESGTHYLRGGARWAAGRSWSVDLSHAHSLAGPLPSFWTLGLTIDIDDD